MQHTHQVNSTSFNSELLIRRNACLPLQSMSEHSTACLMLNLLTTALSCANNAYAARPEVDTLSGLGQWRDAVHMHEPMNSTLQLT